MISYTNLVIKQFKFPTIDWQTVNVIVEPHHKSIVKGLLHIFFSATIVVHSAHKRKRGEQYATTGYRHIWRPNAEQQIDHENNIKSSCALLNQCEDGLCHEQITIGNSGSPHSEGGWWLVESVAWIIVDTKWNYDNYYNCIRL